MKCLSVKCHSVNWCSVRWDLVRCRITRHGFNETSRGIERVQCKSIGHTRDLNLVTVIL